MMETPCNHLQKQDICLIIVKMVKVGYKTCQGRGKQKPWLASLVWISRGDLLGELMPEIIICFAPSGSVLSVIYHGTLSAGFKLQGAILISK